VTLLLLFFFGSTHPMRLDLDVLYSRALRGVDEPFPSLTTLISPIDPTRLIGCGGVCNCCSLLCSRTFVDLARGAIVIVVVINVVAVRCCCCCCCSERELRMN
jgi:hypothetical protein